MISKTALPLWPCGTGLFNTSHPSQKGSATLNATGDHFPSASKPYILLIEMDGMLPHLRLIQFSIPNIVTVDCMQAHKGQDTEASDLLTLQQLLSGTFSGKKHLTES